MAHFSKYIRPGARRIGYSSTDEDLMVTAAQNPDGSVCVVALNMTDTPKQFRLSVGEKSKVMEIDAAALQSIVIEGQQ